MSLYRQFKTDNNLEKEGVILSYGFNADNKPIEIRIARAGGSNGAFNRALEHEMKPYRRQLQTETMDNSVAEMLMKRVYARTVVLGWTGVDIEESENGPAIPKAQFNEENCVRLFNDLPELWRDVQEQAGKAALFRAQIAEEDAKN